MNAGYPEMMSLSKEETAWDLRARTPNHPLPLGMGCWDRVQTSGPGEGEGGRKHQGGQSCHVGQDPPWPMDDPKSLK